MGTGADSVLPYFTSTNLAETGTASVKRPRFPLNTKTVSHARTTVLILKGSWAFVDEHKHLQGHRARNQKGRVYQVISTATYL